MELGQVVDVFFSPCFNGAQLIQAMEIDRKPPSTTQHGLSMIKTILAWKKFGGASFLSMFQWSPAWTSCGALLLSRFDKQWILLLNYLQSIYIRLYKWWSSPFLHVAMYPSLEKRWTLNPNPHVQHIMAFSCSQREQLVEFCISPSWTSGGPLD